MPFKFNFTQNIFGRENSIIAEYRVFIFSVVLINVKFGYQILSSRRLMEYQMHPTLTFQIGEKSEIKGVFKYHGENIVGISLNVDFNCIVRRHYRL
jgi:hypothetical protein